MGSTKTELFSKKQNAMAIFAKAIAHPARIAILELLMSKGSCVCGDIVDQLPLSQATVSQHLKAMKEAKIIKGNVVGPYRCYCIDDKSCLKMFTVLKGLVDKCC